MKLVENGCRLMSHPEEILKYWQAVEYFSPQNIPNANPRASRPVHEIDKNELVPWDINHPLASRDLRSNLTWQHTVYCALYPYSRITDTVEKVFGKDELSSDERSDSENCVFVFALSDTGRPLFESFILSTNAWVLSHLENIPSAKLGWLNGFEKIQDTLKQIFMSYCKLEEGDEEGHELQENGCQVGKHLTSSDLFDLTQLLLKKLDFSFGENELKIRVQSAQCGVKKAYKVNDTDFLNSFFLKDIEKVKKAVKSNNYGSALRKYLATKIDPQTYCDVRHELDVVFEMLSPARFPYGKWPTPSHYPLVLSQQFAVNAIFNSFDKESRGVFAVNGPPGTGKTTLLRDLVAEIVVKRATCLLDYESPSDVFSTIKTGWKSANYQRTVATWPKEFSNFSIVVASNNNGAVENVSLEIPGIDAIDSSWRDVSDYFASVSEAIIGKESWALMAARLGNKQNRNKFISDFWYGKKEVGGIEYMPFLQLLKAEQESPSPVDWKNAVWKFKAALNKEQKLRKAKEDAYKVIADISKLKQDEKDFLSKSKKIKLEIEAKLKEKAKLELNCDLECLRHKLENIEGERLKHRQFKPNLLEALLTRRAAYKSWSQKDEFLQEEYWQVKQLIRVYTEKLYHVEKSLEKLEKELSQIPHMLENIVAQLQSLNSSLQFSAETQDLPDIAVWLVDENKKELASPWADEAWNKARAEVFLEAINLHKAFILKNADIFRKNLQAAMDILGGSVPHNAPKSAVLAAWQTLFFIIPIISTTFASFDRLFNHLDSEEIGWLLIDEAGQATPQSAVGSIWRSKKVIVVGDPLQLEPIVTLPFTAQQALRKYFKVDEKWLPSWSSAQMLADSVTPYGTYLPYGEDKLWVGSPLRVHRRCEDPMFSIANKIAYDNFMVHGLSKKANIILPQSEWRDVSSIQSDGHFIPEELEQACLLIDLLLANKVAPNEIFVISPFRQVVEELYKLRNKNKHLSSLNVGTIHTTQGKEARVVILILGGNPKKQGAKKWASQKPNLLNVAVSRAKQRLYVIGDKSSWKTYPYFDDLAQLI